MTTPLDVFFQEQLPQFTSELEAICRRTEGHSQIESNGIVRELTDCINRSLAHCANLELELRDTPDLLKATQKRYREMIWPWFGQSWCMSRALTKPRGYPGDYELLTVIYDGQTTSAGIGAYLDRYFLNTTLARAVVARMQGVRDFLLNELDQRTGDVVVLNVASGACREYTENFNPPGEGRIQLTCIDNDPFALEFVRTTVAPECTSRVEWEFVRYNALRMTSVGQNHDRFGRPDILYSVGLCDYIPDSYLIPMLSAWRQTIADGGAAYVAFKDGDNYDKTEYQWLVDWYFYQRTAAECRALFTAAGYEEDELACHRDADGVILNFVSRSRLPARVRMDDAEALPKAPQLSPVIMPPSSSVVSD